ncbi:MAG: hypothetical protein NC078_05585 [Ruminococcus sp.]|nr:hypothetical protein [Ruminococcus sp.]
MSLLAEKEPEYGVKYAGEAVNADMEYINSERFAGKFGSITPNEKVNQILLECSRKAIEHRNGTLFEDMYLINAVTGEIEGFQINALNPQGIEKVLIMPLQGQRQITFRLLLCTPTRRVILRALTILTRCTSITMP